MSFDDLQAEAEADHVAFQRWLRDWHQRGDLMDDKRFEQERRPWFIQLWDAIRQKDYPKEREDYATGILGPRPPRGGLSK